MPEEMTEEEAQEDIVRQFEEGLENLKKGKFIEY